MYYNNCILQYLDETDVHFALRVTDELLAELAQNKPEMTLVDFQKPLTEGVAQQSALLGVRYTQQSPSWGGVDEATRDALILSEPLSTQHAWDAFDGALKFNYYVTEFKHNSPSFIAYIEQTYLIRNNKLKIISEKIKSLYHDTLFELFGSQDAHVVSVRHLELLNTDLELKKTLEAVVAAIKTFHESFGNEAIVNAALIPETINRVLHTLNIKFECLPRHDYLREYSRLLEGYASLLNTDDVLVQLYGLHCLVQPFTHRDLQMKANYFVMGFLNTGLLNAFTSVDFLYAVDMLMLDLCIQCATPTDSKMLELLAYNRLNQHKIPDGKLVTFSQQHQTCLNKFKLLLAKEASEKNLTQHALMSQCRDTINSALLSVLTEPEVPQPIPKPTPKPTPKPITPSPHVFFQPTELQDIGMDPDLPRYTR